ncbi:MAG: GNAT family N-acetyltransferase [Pseudomonadota bacterium]
MLTSARLTLRAAEPGDLHDLHAVYSDARTMRYWSSLPHADLSETQEWLDRLIASARDPLLYFVIEHGGRAIGTAGVHENAEVGIILHADFWRQGLGREALETLIPYLFDATDAAALTADADPRNLGSVGLLKSVGFNVTGHAKRTFCVGGEWSDSVYLALPR